MGQQQTQALILGSSLPSMSVALIEGFATAAAQIHAHYSGYSYQTQMETS